MYRLCGEEFVHRRLGDVELHFLAADVFEVGDELQLDLLWHATSADDCVMVGTNFHNQGDKYQYYSFAHTLSVAHLVHWLCKVELMGAQGANRSFDGGGGSRSGATWADASTASFSGFLSVTTCRVPRHVSEALLATGARSDGSIPSSLEVSLQTSGADGGRSSTSWRPEPLRLCPRPAPERRKRRLLSACAGTLHNAERVHSIAPHAVEDWINYHLIVGIEHFTIFDIDGTYEPYLRSFVERGLVTYHPRFPAKVSPKLGLLAAGLREPKEHRSMLMEPHALDVCVWENRQVSDWVVVVHSFEEYLHSPAMVAASGMFSMRTLLPLWGREVARTAVFEVFQEPMGGLKDPGARTMLSAWTHKRGLEIEGLQQKERIEAAHAHFQPFAWIIDPLNVLQTAVHFAQARAQEQAIVVMPRETLRVNHYVDLGSNTSRCRDELGGCEVPDNSITWAEDLRGDGPLHARALGDVRHGRSSPDACPCGGGGCGRGGDVAWLHEAQLRGQRLRCRARDCLGRGVPAGDSVAGAGSTAQLVGFRWQRASPMLNARAGRRGWPAHALERIGRR
mmetsp:Transcript_172603/g.548050  ORF Transcript_172603/g.548050 Transcript_172603/m.548050 type:complete len:565 (-) Transcript_172603:149-1843(-)